MNPQRAVVRDAVAIGLATATFGLSFGAISVAAGLSVVQTAALSLLMFTGASQFALVGVIAGGGTAFAAAAAAALLGARQSFYGLRLAPLLEATGLRRLVAAHLVIDESAAMALGRADPVLARLGFWSTGTAVFVGWNVATVLGALGAGMLADPAAFGLDAVVPAAFVALLAPMLRHREPWMVAAGGALLAIALTPWSPSGLPVLAAGAVALMAGSGRRGGSA